jgi:pimeloyl-ACP methyl ester carboxylesterase/predicted negative regulator of RcsB-dependent stress response
MSKPVEFTNFRPASTAKNNTAIVFVHGFTGDVEKTWRRIPEFLRNDPRSNEWDLLGVGYQSNRRFDLTRIWSSDARLEEIANMLHARPELSVGTYKRLAFAAHSMGGLVVQQALVSYEDLRNRTSHVVLFGTPSGGLTKARFASFWKRQIKNMEAGGPFISALRGKWTSLRLDSSPPFAFVAVAGETDQFVPPESSLGRFPQSVGRVIPGNHLTMLDADSADAPCVQVILQTLGGSPQGALSAAKVAIETGEFGDIIRRLWPNRDSAPDQLHSKLDDYSAVQLAIALERTGDSAAALAVLKSHKPEGTDVLGVLAGRLKRRWWLTGNVDDFKGAQKLYQSAYEQSVAKDPPDHDQAYYHGINLAYLAVAVQRDFKTARTMASKVLEHVAWASDPGLKHWRPATEGDALMILERTDEAIAKHQQAAAQDLKPWEATSMEEQALRVADLCGLGKAQRDKLADAYEGKS